MEDCRNTGMNVLGPDVNESYRKFTVNKDGAIRFGMAGIKGVGEGAVESIIQERDTNGPFKDIYNFVERISLNQVNKKSLEALATAGAFDNLDNIKRGQYFALSDNEGTFIENLVRYGNRYQNDKNSTQQSLFGGTQAIEILKPPIPTTNDWQKLEKLKKEKEIIGIYLSAHPLDDYKFEFDNFCNIKLSEFTDLESIRNRDLTIAGIVSEVKHSMTKTGKPFGFLTIQDYTDSYRFALFGKDYENFRKYCYEDYPLMIKGRVQPRPYNDQELEFKIKTINMLSLVREELVKSISFTIPYNIVNDDFIKTLKEITLAKEGKTQMKFKIIDPEEKTAVDFISRSKGIMITDKLVKYLTENSAIQYSVN
jgi:DNA polymerase-3 subunit alpha